MLENTFKLHAEEHVIMYIRRHIIFLIVDLVSVFLLFILPTILVWSFQYAGLVPNFKVFGVSFYSLTDVLVYMWAIFCWLFTAEKVTDYALDVWILTNKRIVEIELKKLFDIQVSTLELKDIEDITVRNEGFFANYFNYGLLEVQTAGTNREFFAEKILDPGNVQKIIFDAKLKDEREKQDIEKGEVEQIANRVFNSHIPEDQKVKEKVFSENQNENSFDWAGVDQKQEKDTRNTTEEVEEVEDKYKKDIDSALRSEE